MSDNNTTPPSNGLEIDPQNPPKGFEEAVKEVMSKLLPRSPTIQKIERAAIDITTIKGMVPALVESMENATSLIEDAKASFVEEGLKAIDERVKDAKDDAPANTNSGTTEEPQQEGGRRRRRTTRRRHYKPRRVTRHTRRTSSRRNCYGDC